MPTTLPDFVVATAPGQAAVITLPAVAGGAALVGNGQPAGGVLAPNQDQGGLTYTPWPGFMGVDVFAYTVRLAAGAGGALAEGRVLVTVALPNARPVAVDDAASTRPGAAVVVPVLANDSDADGDPLTIAAVVMSGHGTVAVDPADQRRLRYVPQAGFVGRDSFAYTVSDGRGGAATATVNVAVEAANRAPVARDDAAQAVAGAPVTLAVLANDSDPDGDPLRLTGFGLPARGTLAANTDQSVTYTPAAGYAGPDEFTYTADDGRGGSARARVAVEVRRPNAPPVAVPDRATTAAGTPVTVPVLANDNDPDGDPLGLVALGLPGRGTLAVNPDQSVTYAPAAGFSGADEFTYTVADGWGGTATARVEVTVEPPPARPTFANGYLYRRRLVVPAAAAAAGEHQGFPLWVRLQGDWLKPAASTPGGAGRMEAAGGLDLRFEGEDGARLPHEVDAYDAAAGLLQAWVRLPRLSAAAAARLIVYYGKPGQAASEADPAALWADYLAVWHLPSAGDSGPGGRDLAPAGAVADEAGVAGGLAGAVRLAGAGVLRRADAAFLDNLPALTVQLRAKADAVGHERGPLNLGPFGAGAGGDAGSGLTIRYAGAGGGIYAKLGTTAGPAFLTTAAGAQGTGWQALALAWGSGDPRPALYLDGAPAETVSGSQLGAGSAATDVAGPLTVGAGARDTAAGGWQGLLDEVRLRAAKLPAAWLAAERSNQAVPEGFLGAGPEDAPGDARPGVVAVPVAATTRAGAFVDVDVLAAAVVPAGAAAPTLASVGQPQHGTTTVIAGRIRYAPAAGYVGADSFTYVVASGGKTSQGRVGVAVDLPVTVGGTAPLERWPVPLATVRAGGAGQVALRAALTGTLLPGTLVEVADGTYGGAPIEIVADGTAANPIVVTARTVGAARMGCAVVVRGDHVWLRGFAFDDAATYTDPGFDNTEVGGNVVVYGRGCRLLRNSFLRRNTRELEKTCVAVHQDARAPVIAYNHFDHAVDFTALARPTDQNGLKYHFNYLFFHIGDGSANSAGGVVERNHFRRSPGLEAWGGADVPYEGFKTSTLTVGRLDKQDYQYTADILFSENLFQDMGKEAEFSLRCKGLRIARNTFLGRWSKLRMRFTSDMDVSANWFEDCDGISCRGRRHRIRWNRFLAGAELKLEAGNMDIEEVNGTAEATKRPRARDCALVGNAGAVIVGFKVGTGDVVALPAKDNPVRGHLSLAGAVQPGFGAVVTRTDREEGTTFAAAAGEAALVPARLPAAEVGLAYVGAAA